MSLQRRHLTHKPSGPAHRLRRSRKSHKVRLLLFQSPHAVMLRMQARARGQGGTPAPKVCVLVSGC
eukprot:scaffold2546_cov118-Isochrysis_galbana.AAC.1